MTNSTRPEYDQFRSMEAIRQPLAEGFATQILATCGPFLPGPPESLRVLDVGSGYGHTARALAKRCKSVVGIEPSRPLHEYAASSEVAGNLGFRCEGVDELTETDSYDLVVLDNVFEHLSDQPRALEAIHRCLAPGGACFLLMPNKLWPIEVHYGLPFLSYLPLWLANIYLRSSGRGRDYTDASYAPTYWRLNRLLRRAGFEFHYVLPANLSLATKGASLHYRVGVSLIKRFPLLWAISKAFLVVAKKPLR